MMPQQTVLPGQCEPVPQVNCLVHSLDQRQCWQVSTHVVPGLDIDGSGAEVVLVPLDATSLRPDTLRWRLYLMRGACGYRLGELDGLDDPFLLPGASHGLRNLGTLQPVADAVGLRGNQRMTRYRYDGREYRPGRRERR